MNLFVYLHCESPSNYHQSLALKDMGLMLRFLRPPGCLAAASSTLPPLLGWDQKTDSGATEKVHLKQHSAESEQSVTLTLLSAVRSSINSSYCSAHPDCLLLQMFSFIPVKIFVVLNRRTRTLICRVRLYMKGFFSLLTSQVCLVEYRGQMKKINLIIFN